MKTSSIQAEFAKNVALLILYIESCGYHVTFGDAYAKSGHKKGSFHYKKLAIDLNLFDEQFNYLSETEDHLPFGKYWEFLGGSWGGSFKNSDGNHYSWGEE